MAKRVESIIGYGIFASRWIQAPLYAGLIVAQVAYAWKFGIELWHLIGHTTLLLFDPRRDPPVLLRAGDRVRFRPSGA